MQELVRHSQDTLKALNRSFRRSFFSDNPFNCRMSVLLGQRGVGKTTVLIQYLLDYVQDDVLSDEILYVASDHFLMKGRALYEVADAFVKHGGKLICLDEIHKYANWSQELKSIYDSFPKLKVIASGSSALEVYKGSHDLTRRAIKYHLQGLSFREYLEFQYGLKFSKLTLSDLIATHQHYASEVVDQVDAIGKKILPLFKEYLRYGYYPYMSDFKEDMSLYYAALEQNVHTIIESDLMSIYPTLTGVTIQKIKRLLAFLSYQTPYKVDVSKLMQAVDVSHANILKTYLKYLNDADVINALCEEGKSLGAFSKPQKLYHANTNQLYALAGDQFNLGTIRETFFINAFKNVIEVYYSKKGDFNVAGNIFEVGGKSKGFKQLKGVENGFLALDDTEIGIGNRIPLWLMGFLY